MKLISGDRSLCSLLNLGAAGDLKGTVQNVQAAVTSTLWTEAAGSAVLAELWWHCTNEGKMDPSKQDTATGLHTPPVPGCFKEERFVLRFSE